MTRRYSNANWLDVLYTSVRDTSGGVVEAAAYLTNRRGRSITSEALRLRLAGQGDHRLSMEMFELLIEWMQERGRPDALNAVHALNERFDLIAAPIENDTETGSANTVALHTLDLARHTGKVADEVRAALADGKITPVEAEAIAAAARASQRMLDRLVRAARRASRRESQ